MEKLKTLVGREVENLHSKIVAADDSNLSQKEKREIKAEMRTRSASNLEGELQALPHLGHEEKCSRKN